MLSSALFGGLLGLGASPYLARLTVTVPDRDASAWWRGRAASTSRAGRTLVVAALLGALAGYGAHWRAELPAFLVLALACAPLAVIDVEHHRLPDRLVYSALVAECLVFLGVAIVRSDWHALLRSVESGAVVFAAFYVLALTSPRSFGLGDVKLVAVLAIALGWVGWLYVYSGIVLGFLLAAATAIALLAARRATTRTAIPFGPLLILGTFVTLAVAR